MRILLCEKDAALAGFLCRALEAEHFAVEVARDVEQARVLSSAAECALLVLDLDLDAGDGVTLLRQVRMRRPALPLLVLLANAKIEERVRCFEAGADDLLPKPFAFAELSARVRALVRRCRLPAACVLTVADLQLDRLERRVERGGRVLELTAREFSLLEFLMRYAGRRVTRSMILEQAWQMPGDRGTNLVDVFVNALRQKLDRGFPIPLLHTVRGVGYRLASSAERAVS